MKYCSDRNYGCRYMALQLREKNILILENEKIRITVMPDNGCDIADINYKPTDTSFLWRTRQGLSSLSAPDTALNDSFNQTYHGGWFEAFPNVGLACNYKGINFKPYDEIKYLGWDYQIVKDDPEEIIIIFSVRTLKTPFTLEKKLSLHAGSASFLLEEKITNTGKEPVPYQWGHHPLLGHPFLSGDCIIDFSGADIDTFFEFENARVKQGVTGTWPLVTGKDGNVDLTRFPKEGSDINDLYWLSNLKSDWIAVRNRQQNIGIGFAWDLNMFNHCLLWINANGDKGYPHYGEAYTLCIMPSTSGIHTIEAEAAEGQISFLGAGEDASSWIGASVFVPDDKKVGSIDKKGNVEFLHETR